MKDGRILKMLVLIMIFFLISASQAAPMGTAFTYQGHLYDANYAADGLYDFAFKLYDANSGGSKIGTDVNVGDVDVIDGYFTVELDFGSSAFDGDARWLEVGVRQGDLNDPNGYTTLSPRQKVTAAPYALYAKNSAGDSDWIITGSNMYSGVSGNVGIGSTIPAAKLEVRGDTDLSSQIRSIRNGGATAMFGGGQFEGRVGTYSNHPFVISTNLTERVRVDAAGNVGIGTTAPTKTLDVDGDAGVSGDVYLEGILNLNDSSNTTYIQNVDDGLKFWVDTLGTPIAFDFQVTDDSYMTILNNGDVGIGTTSPERKLHVQESASTFAAEIENTATVNSLGLSIETGSSDASAAFRIRSDGSIVFYVTNEGLVEIPNNNLLVQGSVGIGTYDPARKLHVNDTMRLEPRGSAPPSPSEGDMYMNSTTHKLMVYDGTQWQACW